LLKARREGALGEITDVKTFQTGEEALQWVAGVHGAPPVKLSFGIMVPQSEKAMWKKECLHAEEIEYLMEHGFYDTASSFAVSTFFQSGSSGAFIHVNRNIQGLYVILACRKY
jgi:hypothetical protein